ncbi:hypothetical protein GCM10023306_07130 [Novosphingobium ginsenosidimutans]|uniref:DUF5672 domain-containing protein n=1 Tax=Novosphingobium ginsenosidimutans TaxID=1176536 RepID=A0A5B8S5X4_9SPHN|nr:hypothetical protein FRF71_06535 [Novosphingobium ginsenosidimutans]
MARLALPQITLCAATSVNVAATIAAMQHSMALCDFGAAVLLTDQVPDLVPEGIEIRPIERLTSAEAYSRFMLAGEMAQHVATSHLLVVQWDGFVVSPAAWDADFLDFDYIGAIWPQFDDGAVVGNGGFSLRSKRLLEACKSLGLNDHPEDVTICRTHRLRLQHEFGIRFADPTTAARFSYERSSRTGAEFGFHGVFNLPEELGPDGFWQTYLALDDRRTLWPDFKALVWFIVRRKHGLRRALRMVCDRLGEH